MRKVWAVVRREFLERVRSRAFVIGTVLGPVFMGVLFLLPILLQQGTGPRRIVVLDAATGGFGVRVVEALSQATRGDEEDSLPRYVVVRVPADGRLEAVRDSLVALTDRRDLGARALDGVLVVTDEALVTDTLRYLGSNAGSLDDMRELSRTLRQAVLTEKLSRSGIDLAVLVNTLKPVELTTSKVTKGRLTGQSGTASFLLAYVMSFMLYFALLLYGVQVMTSTVEEKTTRINEVLVSSLRPFELLLGKVIGVGSVGLLQLGIWAGVAFLLGSFRGGIAELLGAPPEAAAALPIPEIPFGLLMVFLLFFVLGFFFYAAAYAAVGSSCNTVQETQQASMPVTIFILLGLMAMFRLLNEPNGQLAQIMSLVPPLAPFVTPVRHSLSPLSLPEMSLSVAATVLGVLGMAWIAGRIYRVGILMYGKRASIREMVRWVRVG